MTDRIKRKLLFWMAILETVCLANALRAEMNFQLVTLDASRVAYERDVADINLDGQNDVVCVSESETAIRAYLAPDWTPVVVTTPSGPCPWPRADDFKATDMDGDGDADLVARLGPAQNSDAAGIAAWFENLNGTGWVQRTIGDSPDYVKDICVADLDRDGKMDVVMRHDSATRIYMQETGSWTLVTLTHAAHEGMEVADLDMDGDPDIILNGFWFATPDTPAEARLASNYTQTVIDAAWFNQTGDWTANSCKVVAGDFDGDGSNDVAFSHSERAGYAVTWYRSPTPRIAGSWTAHPLPVVDYCHNLQAADWDLDGDADLLVGGMANSQHRGIKLWLNLQRGTNWSEFTIQTDGSYSAETGDIDNDGDPDIVGINNWNSAPTWIYRNNAGGGPSLDFWFYHPVSVSHTRTFGLCFPDLDGDGDLDIASGRFLYRNPGPPMTGTWAQVTLPGSGHAFATLDVDGDSLADLIDQQDNPGANRLDLYWLETSNAAATAWHTPRLIGNVPRSEHAEGFQGYRIADLDGTPPLEIVISSMGGIYAFAIPASNPEAGAWPRTLLASNDSDEGIGAADLDADGDTDIAFTSGAARQVKWARNPGNGSAPWDVFTIGSFPEADWPDRCDIADLNRDGRPDIVVTEENGGSTADALACWWEQPAAGPTNGGWTRHTLATQYTMNSLDTGDVDRDGHPDIALAEHRGTLRIAIWQNDGTGGFREKRVGTGRENHLGARLADLDGDGDLDLAGIAYDNYTQVHLWRNDSASGVPTVASPFISPPGGIFDEPLAATLFCPLAGAGIWYTTDGTDPTNQPPATLYENGPVPVAQSLTLKARAFKDEYQPSRLATAVFTGPKVRTPSIVPPGGTFSSSQTVSIACATTGATLRVTLDGADPGESSPLYGGPLTLEQTTTVKARAYRAGLAPSDVAEATFTRFTLVPAAHWRLDERVGPFAMDSGGYSRTGRVVGAVWDAGRHDNSLRFDGADDRVECGSWSVTGTALTLCAWIKLDAAFVDNDARILSKATGPGEQDHWWMLSTTTVGQDRRLRFRLKTGGTTTTLIASSGHLPLSTWIHAAATYDGASLRLFADGIESGSAAVQGNLDTTESAPVWIGANPPGAYAPFQGWIDDVRLYNTALEADDIQAIMDQSPSRHAPRFLDHQPTPGGGFQLHAAGEPGHFLYLEQATNLMQAQWEDVAFQALTSGNTAVFGATNTVPQWFHRLRLE